MKLGIDVLTKDKAKLMKRLAALRTTFWVVDGGEYHQDSFYSQVHINTTWSEEQLDDWLYKTNHECDYVGVFKLKQVEAA